MITADARGTLPSSLRSTHLSLRGERADGGGNAGMLAGAGAGGRGRESGGGSQVPRTREPCRAEPQAQLAPPLPL